MYNSGPKILHLLYNNFPNTIYQLCVSSAGNNSGSDKSNPVVPTTSNKTAVIPTFFNFLDVVVFFDVVVLFDGSYEFSGKYSNNLLWSKKPKSFRSYNSNNKKYNFV